MGVTPAIGSLENSPMRKASAPPALPSRYTGLPLMPATTPVYSAFCAAQAHQDDVALRAVRVLQNAQDFDVHGFRLRALKNGVGDAVHSGMDVHSTGIVSTDLGVSDRKLSLETWAGRSGERKNKSGGTEKSVRLMKFDPKY